MDIPFFYPLVIVIGIIGLIILIAGVRRFRAHYGYRARFDDVVLCFWGIMFIIFSLALIRDPISLDQSDEDRKLHNAQEAADELLRGPNAARDYLQAHGLESSPTPVFEPLVPHNGLVPPKPWKPSFLTGTTNH